jgi:pyruvate dehydrogenase (quinone)
LPRQPNSDVSYPRFAELIGRRGIFADRPRRLADARQEALSSDRPVVLEVTTGPNVGSLLPHITRRQAKACTPTLLNCNPEEGSMIIDTAKEVLSGLPPGRRHQAGRGWRDSVLVKPAGPPRR